MYLLWFMKNFRGVINIKKKYCNLLLYISNKQKIHKPFFFTVKVTSITKKFNFEVFQTTWIGSYSPLHIYISLSVWYHNIILFLPCFPSSTSSVSIASCYSRVMLHNLKKIDGQSMYQPVNFVWTSFYYSSAMKASVSCFAFISKR